MRLNYFSVRFSLFLFCISCLLSQRALSSETLGPSNGALYISGGGNLNLNDFVMLVKQTTGKQDPVIRVMTTPQGKRRQKGFDEGAEFRVVTVLKEKFKLSQTSELYTLSSETADMKEFYGAIDSADAVFITGGNQCYLTDTFLKTETLQALHRLLQRGGIIGGSSAGAQVQSSFMTRGDYTERAILGDGNHQIGFGFVRNAAFDVHVEERGREKALFELFEVKPGQLQDRTLDPMTLLGIGIDQGTAITVVGNQFTVSGTGNVYVFDPEKWNEKTRPYYDRLVAGMKYDLKDRQPIGAEKKSAMDRP